MKFIIAAGPVIIENSKVLLVKHGQDDFWKFPGGRVEDFSELDLQEHAQREAKEELGIDTEIVRPLKTLMVKQDDTLVVLVHYLARRVGEITPGPDIREWRWIDLNRLPTDLAPNIFPIIQECGEI